MKKIIISTIIVFLCVALVSIRNDEKLLQIYALDVGQGDAILIISPDNKKFLIDTGKDDSAAKRLKEVLGPFDNHLDYVLITHPDSDHAGGYKYVADYYTVADKIENASDNSDFTLGCCVSIDFVWPQGSSRSAETNENSAAFFLKYGNFLSYFDGDLPSKQEDLVAKKYPYDISVLKVSHHGSSSGTDSYMLSVFKPEIALISVGKNNPYHHPTAKTLLNLKNADIQVYRTDELGTIHLTSDGQTVSYTLNN